ncbi:hypothetical protein MNEG_15574 [Monoraphidium neglectum]|uniref:Glycosyltransferase family 28 N-terminal domain-containing protein n=1 Tax=Monoraphidium neglectum TaxID=145388 RepID=A0A0D2K8C3_9CHLO|nr:hypothetical protein MNEG_15574 [Monoraphidium neglectum]KIY92388.1 hypothetical protein MNEG_15574 [Monoraphidium neglectum]|eukprot:XP_013891408.1 hypothetical protein MNEG_15574 [Monoraphidium neglectum]
MADVLILCCGSRGDTEPWARLAAGLRESGLRVALAAHGEYEQLAAAIAGPDVPFREVRGSLPRALVESPEGAALRARTGLGALAAFRDLMVPLAQVRGCGQGGQFFT